MHSSPPLPTPPHHHHSYFEVEELLPAGDEVEAQAVHGAGQSDTPDEQDQQHQVGERRRHVHHLQGGECDHVINNILQG